MEPVPETREVLTQLTREGDVALVAVVHRLGEAAREVVPECIGLSLGLLEDGLTFTLVATDEEIAALDSVQYLDGGPCVDAAHAGETLEVAMDGLAEEERWQLYAQASAAAGVASSLTLPIERDGEVIGSINLYGATPDAFEGHHEELAAALATSAEHAVANADLSFSTRRAAAAGPDRLADLHDIDVALGMIAEAQGVTIATARERLRAAAARAGISQGQAARVVRGVRPAS